ncbi:EamA domain-containing membrane protein RarD [Nitrosomonas cryotolerans]|uniref:EamA domain-containing membrane protein RarD n=1 Tax=Nitrosomonas cryotolerans ATCC 49181 TaxID=1131553 RepID=A0A1N6G2G8_9PROT|nr:DMT family transporter [Nitrosomonas cryotolerans]SFQ07875.1 EamA domain-containing membrane protein RarD [Nitrosomonas cryotolerans]SIO01756.1 EamA domain-containing membrane protein RarD [Nitrosomonas cryotolerans ATCC 49181]
MNESNQKTLPIAALLLGAAIWGVLWYPYRLLEGYGMSGEIATTITFCIALLLGIIFFRKEIQFSSIFNGKAHLLFWIGFCAGWSNLAYILGMLNGEVMRVLLLFYLAPIWTILFSRILLSEQLSIHGYFVIMLSFAGVVTMLWQPGSDLLMPISYGEWLGMVGGFMFALMNVLTRKNQFHNVQLKSMAIWLGVTVIGLVCSLAIGSPLTLPYDSFNPWLFLAGIGLVLFVLSIVLQYGLTRMPANQAIVILLFELIVAALAAYFLVNEVLSPMEWVGGAMIVSAGLFSTRINRA